MAKLLMDIHPYDYDHYISEAYGGGLKAYDAFELYKIIKKFKPQNILEVGSYVGLSTKWILKCTEPYESQVTSVDANIPHRAFGKPRDIFNDFVVPKYKNRLTVFNAFLSDGTLKNELTQIYSDLVNHWMPSKGQQYDMIFLDAGHSYSEVCHDFYILKKSLSKDGIIVFHDAESWPGVKKLMREIKADVMVPFWYKLLKKSFNKRNMYIDGICI